MAFSPFLYNQRGSLIFINYFIFFISSVVVFRTALLCGVSRFWAFVITLLLAAMPWNFQALMTFNLASLMPEPIFVGASLCAMILLSWLIAYPYSRKTAIVAGFALGATIWSRGNAFLYLTMPLAGFALAILLRFIWPKWRLDIRVIAGFALAAVTCAAMAAIYFYFTHRSIYNYYSGDAVATLSNYQRKLTGAKWILLNMPGLSHRRPMVSSALARDTLLRSSTYGFWTRHCNLFGDRRRQTNSVRRQKPGRHWSPWHDWSEPPFISIYCSLS